jgi:hypothetical protein
MNDLFILGSAEPGEARETMVEFCLWAIFCTFMKINNVLQQHYCNFCTGIHMIKISTRATKEGKIIKSTVNT